MILNKYSKAKENNSATIGSYSARPTSSSSSSSSNRSVGLDREIWGQEDDGGDLNGDLTCEGNLYIVDNWDDGENSEDEEEDEEGYAVATVRNEPIMTLSIAEDLQDKFDNEEGGNLYVKRQLVVEQDTYSKEIYLDYPTVKYEDDSNKTNLLDLIKDHKKLTIKDSKGNELGTFDNTADKTITIKNYDDDITSIKKAKSVVLATVDLVRNTPYSNYTFTINASMYDGITFNNVIVGEGCIDCKFDVDVTKISGLRNLYANSAIGATQNNSDSDSEILNGTSSSKSCDGAYGGMWTNTRVVLSSDKRTLVVRARIWHKDKDDNESVDSNKDWSVNAITNISFIVAGEPL